MQVTRRHRIHRHNIAAKIIYKALTNKYELENNTMPLQIYTHNNNRK